MCAHESYFYEGNTACTLFFCQTKKCGLFQAWWTGRVSEDFLKHVDGTSVMQIVYVCGLQLMPKMLPPAA